MHPAVPQDGKEQTREEREGRTRLSVAPEGEGVVALPGLSATGTGLVVAVALVETTGLLAGGGEAAGLAVLVDGVDDPVDAGVDADGLVLGVDQDNLVVLVDTVLVDPIGVQDAKVTTSASDTFFSNRTKTTLELEVVDTLADGFAVRSTLRDGLLAVATAYANAVDDIALLGLVAQTTGLVEARGTRGAVDNVQLTELY